MRKTRRKKFADFEVETLLLQDDLQGLLSSSKGYNKLKVGFDLQTADKIEAYYLDVLNGKEKISASMARFDRIFIAYIGEAIMERVGGNWTLCEDEGDPAYETPVITGWTSDTDAVSISPVLLREDLRKNKKPGVLRQMIEYAIRREEEFRAL